MALSLLSNVVEGTESLIVVSGTRVAPIRLAGSVHCPYFCLEDLCAFLKRRNCVRKILDLVGEDEYDRLGDILGETQRSTKGSTNGALGAPRSDPRAIYVTAFGMRRILDMSRSSAVEAIKSTLDLDIVLAVFLEDSGSVERVSTAFPSLMKSWYRSPTQVKLTLYLDRTKVSLFGGPGYYVTKSCGKKFLGQVFRCATLDGRRLSDMEIVGTIMTALLNPIRYYK